MRRINRSQVLALLREGGAISRADLTRRTGMSKATISALVGDLLRARVVTVDGPVSARRGRPPIMLRFNTRAGMVMGVDLSRPRLVAAGADLAGAVIAQRSLPWPRSRRGIYRALHRIVRDVVTQSGLPAGRLLGIAVGTPGAVDITRGHVLGAAPNLPDWHQVPLQAVLERRFHVPVFVENDVNIALWGERIFGACRGVQNALLLWGDVGVGGALAVNGAIYHGSHFSAGELGYIPVSGPAGQIGPGPLETSCSEPAIVGAALRLAERGRAPAFKRLLSAGRPARIATVVEAVRRGDGGLRRLLHEVGERIGLALAAAVATVDPEVIIIGGSIAVAGSLLLPRIEAILRRTCPSPPRLLLSELGEEAVLRGAIAAALERTAPLLAGGIS